MLGLIKNGEYVKQVAEDGALYIGADYLSNAYAGWAIGDYSLHTIKSAEPVPEGKHITGTTVELDNGVWTYVNTLEEIHIPTPEELRALMPELTPRQFRDALIDADIIPDHVAAAIGLIPNEKQRAKALNAWEYPTQFTRTDPLIDQIGGMFNLTPEQIDRMWQQALSA